MKSLFSEYDSLQLPEAKSIIEKFLNFLSTIFPGYERENLRHFDINRQLSERERTVYGVFRVICDLLREYGPYCNDLFCFSDRFRLAFPLSRNIDGDMTLFFLDLSDKLGVKFEIDYEEYDKIWDMNLLEFSKFIYKKAYQ